jgi:methylated-DNA-[protein]-cysteine S-methyltransferase
VDFSRYPTDLSSLPSFVQRALLAARGIPYGQVRTYGWVAARAGDRNAARAAGQAMSRNPVALLVPCHRVVGAGGKLTGFGGGLPMKRALLELEGLACRRNRVDLSQRQSLARRRR